MSSPWTPLYSRLLTSSFVCAAQKWHKTLISEVALLIIASAMRCVGAKPAVRGRALPCWWPVHRQGHSTYYPTWSVHLKTLIYIFSCNNTSRDPQGVQSSLRRWVLGKEHLQLHAISFSFFFCGDGDGDRRI